MSHDMVFYLSLYMFVCMHKELIRLIRLIGLIKLAEIFADGIQLLLQLI